MQFGLKRALPFGLVRKFLAIGFFAFVLLVVLHLIGGIIDERQRYRDDVARDIASSWTGPQKVMGPMIVAPYKVVKKVDKWVFENGTRVGTSETLTSQKAKYFLPETMSADGKVDIQFRYRGIYSVPVYVSSLSLKAQFDVSKALEEQEEGATVVWGRPYLVLGVGDIRGISQSPVVKAGGRQLDIEPGTNTRFLTQGIHALLEPLTDEPQTLSVHIALSLQGMEQLSFLPAGKSTRVRLSSSWPHPSFTGRFLPKERQVSEAGFEALWETTSFSSNVIADFERCALRRKCGGLHANHFGVQFRSGVDVYVQSDRAIKYAMLFVGLTFVAFFMFEILRGLRIHPIQYGLVGFALALFYLLLLSLSEHIDFMLSYAIAAAACAGLIGFYVSSVLGSVKRGAAFGFGLIALYGALLMLIGSEDYALLLGSALLFGVLAFIMAVTRNVDWHAAGKTGQADTEQEMSRSQTQ